MKIIRLSPNPSGGYPSPQDWSGPSLPEGFAEIPAGFDLTTYYSMQGFVTLTVVDDIVTGMAANQAAKDANDVAYPATPAANPEPTVEEDNDAMLVDHEYRLTLLELGVGEEVTN